MKVSAWVMEDHCSLRYILGADKKAICNRVAVHVNWLQGPKGCTPEYGEYQPSRDWCDKQLNKMGYILTEEE